MPYDPAAIEAKWQAYWREHEIFRSRARSEPSRSTTCSTCSRTRRAPGCTSAIPRATPRPTSSRATSACAASTCCTRWAGTRSACPPSSTRSRPARTRATTTAQNIDDFRRQLKRSGSRYDWAREVDTTDPSYYRWTQWIFAQLFERGLAYQAEVPVNWCPALGTVLANEEVIDGKSERGGHPVVRMPLRQWMLRITAYAERLLDDLERVDWPESIKKMQRDWIGRSEGAEVALRASTGTPASDRGVHHAARHAVRRDLHGARARAPAGRRRSRRRRSARAVDGLRRRRPRASSERDAQAERRRTKTGVVTGALRRSTR